MKNKCCGVKWQQISASYIYVVQWLWCWACVMTAWLLVGSMLLHFWVHFTSHWGGGSWHLQKRWHPTKVGMCWLINVWVSDAGHIGSLLHKFLQDMCWTPAPVLNCTHGRLNFQHKALCVLHSWGNLCSFAEMVSNNKENSKLAMTCVQFFLYVRWQQRDGRDVYRPPRYTRFSAYPQGGFHQHPCVYTSIVTSFASSGPVLINVCVQEMSTQTWFTFAELKVDLDLGQCSSSLVPTAKLKCGVLLSGSSLANCSDMNFHWTSSAASENNIMKRWNWWIA